MALNLSPQINLPANTHGASSVIDPSFMGFGIEAISFYDYSGTKDKRNTFSQNLFDAFYEKTGSPIIVRVGGTSMDNTKYDPNAVKAVDYPDGNGDGLHSNVTLGKPWLDTFSAFDHNKYIIQVPLARQHVDNTVEFTKACVSAMGGTKNLEAVEIGNEPDLYPKKDRGADYGPQNYAGDFRKYADAIRKGSGLGDGRAFQVLTYAWLGGNRGKWTAEAAFTGNNAIDKEGWAKTASEHYYQVHIQDKPPSMQDTIMNHNSTKNVVNSFNADINWLAKNHKDVPFILGEVGVALDSGKGFPYTFSATFGAALWTVDFALYALTIGVKRVNMQMGTNFAFSAWQPIDTKARKKQTNAGFYGQLFVADLIGKDRNLRVKELNVDANHPHIVAYGAWSNDKLSKVVVINLNTWSKDGGDRKKVEFTIGGLDGYKSAKVEHLASPNGAEEQNDITLGGFEWTVENDGKPKKKVDNTKTVDVKDKKITVTVSATEALLIKLNH